MNVVVEQSGPCRRKLNIEVPAEAISSEYNQALKAYSQNAAIPGFRKGKAPANMVKARYDKQILEHLRDQLLPKSYQEALAKESLEVEQIIEVDDNIQVKVGEPLSFAVTVDVKPDFTLPEYKGIALTRQKKDISDADVDEALEGLRERQASFEDVTDRAVVTGDLVQVDFTGTLDGKPLAELDAKAEGVGEGKDFWLQADENAFIPEIGEALPGLNIGETTDVTATFADDFVVDALQGKSVDYKVTVKGVRGRVLPEVDAAFLEKIGVESEEDLRTKLKENLVEQDKHSDDARLRGEIEKFLMESTELDLPESVVAQEANRQIRRIVDQATRQGMSEDQFETQREEILGSAQKAAQEAVKMRYILTRVAKNESLEVNSQEVQREMAMMAYGYGMQPADLERQIKENNAMEDFRGDILVRKAITWLLDNANISE